MNEMYDMSIVTHYYSVVGVLAVIFLNLTMLLMAKERELYARKVSLFMPIGIMTIVAVIFTGVVMMASKHLNFTLENIVMIIIAIVLIVLENRRSSKLITLLKTEVGAFEAYKREALNILLLEALLVLGISAWMLR
jgi:hypothetical protein